MKSFIEFLNEQRQQANGFAILKPGFTNYKGEFMNELNKNGWTVLDQWKKKLSKDQASELYKQHSNQPWYGDLVYYMSSDDSECFKCYKDCKDPIEDMKSIKQKCRDMWAEDDMHNAVHSSDSLDNVQVEADICSDVQTVI